MQASDFNPWLECSVTEVLDAMCFIATNGYAKNDDEATCQPDWICGKLDFKGYPSGSFGVAVSPRTGMAIAANFFGEEEHTISEVQVNDVICELTNMMCGTLLAHLEPKRTFNLSSPSSHDWLGETTSQADRIARTFALDEGYLHAWLEIRVTA
jgi:CheY-specific phosphatase CheX